MKRKDILFIKMNNSSRDHLISSLRDLNYSLVEVNDETSALTILKDTYFKVIILDSNTKILKIYVFVKQIKEVGKDFKIIVLSNKADINEAISSIKMGAYEYLIDPIDENRFSFLLKSLLKEEEFSSINLDNKYRIITQNKKMKEILDQAKRIADSDASVLITGESGTGKELLARFIHINSNRSSKPFIAINCSALPETLLESELFGFEKGAFTGAISQKKGKFELADGGTILLDEITEIPLQLQSKLLRVIQEKEIDRIGGKYSIPVDIRIISTSNRDIEIEVEKGNFREDLFYRINVIPFHIPPLRERKEDIPLLVRYFIKKYNEKNRRNIKGITDDAINRLIEWPWKGNIRELQNVIERAILLSKTDIISSNDIYMSNRPQSFRRFEDSYLSTLNLKEMEKKVILRALDKTNGNRTHAAEILGISVRTLRNKLNEYKKTMNFELSKA